MQTFMAYEAPSASKNRAYGPVLVPQGPSKFALIAPPIFLIWHRLWWELVAYCAFVFLVILPLATSQPIILLGLNIIPPLYLFLEGNALREAALERRGFCAIGHVVADSAAEAEEILAHQSVFSSSSNERPTSEPIKTPQSAGFGLFGLEA